MKSLADRVPEDFRKEVEQLASRVQQLSSVTLNDYGTFLDIIFDNQDRIETLEQRVERVTEDLADSRTREEALVEEVNALRRILDRIESLAVLRQFAINVEYEVKLDLLGNGVLYAFAILLEAHIKLQLLGLVEKYEPAAVQWYKSAYGPNVGQWRQGEILDLRLGVAEDLARTHVPEGEVENVLRKWYTVAGNGNAENLMAGRQVFSDTMRAMKSYTIEGAHPTTFQNQPVSVDVARELLSATDVFKTDVLRAQAMVYVDLLAEIREENGQARLLYA